MEDNLFNFFISGVKDQVFTDSHLWQLPLSGQKDNRSVNSNFTTGDYFLAVSSFLSKNSFTILKTGLHSIAGKPVKTDQISHIKIFLEKHGAFYHPLKIKVNIKDSQTCMFVVNGAVSQRGLALIQKEYALIDRLNQTYSEQYLPNIFGMDFIKTDSGKAGFFLGLWFENFKEFHISDNSGKRQIAIWESDGSCNYIQISKAFEIYRKISKILTSYYNIETFEQILSWHHAAGDFIVHQDNDRFIVRLITVRKYSALTQFEAEENDQKKMILPSLLLFFLNLTVKVRIDRLNGTDRLVMIEKPVINFIVDGFLSVLEEKSALYEYGDIKSAFIDFFLQFNLEQIIELTQNSVESNCSDPFEISLIKNNLKAHCKSLYSIFKNS